MKIVTNVSALRASSSALLTERNLARISQKLSTGVKISSVKHDPAGMSTSNRLKMQSTGTRVANQNSLNGISVLQTADAALSEIHSMLQRVRELSVRSANDTCLFEDRLKMQIEIGQILLEIDSISEKTNYNGIDLINGHAGLMGKSAQVSVSGISGSIQPGVYGLEVLAPATRTVVEFSKPAAPWDADAFPSDELAGNFFINGIEVEITAKDTWQDAYEKLEQAASIAGITIERKPDGAITLVSDYYGADYDIVIETQRFETVPITDIDPNSTLPPEDPGYYVQVPVETKLLNAMGLGEPSTYLSRGSDAQLGFTDPRVGFTDRATLIVDGDRVTVNDLYGRRMTFDINPHQGDSSRTLSGAIEINVDDNRLIFHTGANMDMNMDISLGDASVRALGVDRVNVGTVEGAEKALIAVDNAIGRCSDLRSKVGAFQNRLELISVNLDNIDLAANKALSKAFDTDMAFEMAEFSRNQIVNQGALAILGQANQRPQSVLQLIK